MYVLVMSGALNSSSHLPLFLEFQDLLFLPPVDATMTAVELFFWFKKRTPVLTDYLHCASRQASDRSLLSAFQKVSGGSRT